MNDTESKTLKLGEGAIALRLLKAPPIGGHLWNILVRGFEGASKNPVRRSQFMSLALFLVIAK